MSIHTAYRTPSLHVEIPAGTLEGVTTRRVVEIADPEVADLVSSLVATNERLRAEIADLQPPF